MKHSAYLVALSTVLLAACGGGSSDPAPVTAGVTTAATTTDTTAATTTDATVTPTIAAAAPSVGECFELTPGVKFIRSDGYKMLNVQETFEGSSAFGDVELRSDDTRFVANYQTISGGFVHLLGDYQYAQTGELNEKEVYSSGYQFPVDMAIGQTVQLNYTDTVTVLPIGTPSTRSLADVVTFVGFENLTLAGRVFANTCKFTLPAGSAGQVRAVWVAKGFGAIRREWQDTQGVMVAGSRVELATIVSAP